MRLIALALSIICLIPELAVAGVLEGTVVHVADGDTIIVLDTSKQQHKIRITVIDAPEKGQSFSIQEEAWRVGGEEGGPRRV